MFHLLSSFFFLLALSVLPFINSQLLCSTTKNYNLESQCIICQASLHTDFPIDDILDSSILLQNFCFEHYAGCFEEENSLYETCVQFLHRLRTLKRSNSEVLEPFFRSRSSPSERCFTQECCNDPYTIYPSDRNYSPSDFLKIAESKIDSHYETAVSAWEKGFPSFSGFGEKLTSCEKQSRGAKGRSESCSMCVSLVEFSLLQHSTNLSSFQCPALCQHLVEEDHSQLARCHETAQRIHLNFYETTKKNIQTQNFIFTHGGKVDLRRLYESWNTGEKKERFKDNWRGEKSFTSLFYPSLKYCQQWGCCSHEEEGEQEDATLEDIPSLAKTRMSQEKSKESANISNEYSKLLSSWTSLRDDMNEIKRQVEESRIANDYCGTVRMLEQLRTQLHQKKKKFIKVIEKEYSYCSTLIVQGGEFSSRLTRISNTPSVVANMAIGTRWDIFDGDGVHRADDARTQAIVAQGSVPLICRVLCPQFQEKHVVYFRLVYDNSVKKGWRLMETTVDGKQRCESRCPRFAGRPSSQSLFFASIRTKIMQSPIEASLLSLLATRLVMTSSSQSEERREVFGDMRGGEDAQDEREMDDEFAQVLHKGEDTFANGFCSYLFSQSFSVEGGGRDIDAETVKTILEKLRNSAQVEGNKKSVLGEEEFTRNHNAIIRLYGLCITTTKQYLSEAHRDCREKVKEVFYANWVEIMQESLVTYVSLMSLRTRLLNRLSEHSLMSTSVESSNFYQMDRCESMQELRETAQTLLPLQKRLTNRILTQQKSDRERPETSIIKTVLEILIEKIFLIKFFYPIRTSKIKISDLVSERALFQKDTSLADVLQVVSQAAIDKDEPLEDASPASSPRRAEVNFWSEKERHWWKTLLHFIKDDTSVSSSDINTLSRFLEQNVANKKLGRLIMQVGRAKRQFYEDIGKWRRHGGKGRHSPWLAREVALAPLRAFYANSGPKEKNNKGPKKPLVATQVQRITATRRGGEYDRGIETQWRANFPVGLERYTGVSLPVPPLATASLSSSIRQYLRDESFVTAEMVVEKAGMSRKVLSEPMKVSLLYLVYRVNALLMRVYGRESGIFVEMGETEEVEEEVEEEGEEESGEEGEEERGDGRERGRAREEEREGEERRKRIEEIQRQVMGEIKWGRVETECGEIFGAFLTLLEMLDSQGSASKLDDSIEGALTEMGDEDLSKGWAQNLIYYILMSAAVILTVLLVYASIFQTKLLMKWTKKIPPLHFLFDRINRTLKKVKKRRQRKAEKNKKNAIFESDLLLHYLSNADQPSPPPLLEPDIPAEKEE